MTAVEGLLSMAVLKDKCLPQATHQQIEHIHESLLFYDEHTFGASESVSDPLCENSQVQWGEKSAYAWEAVKRTQMLYETSVGLLQGDLRRGKNPTLTIFNTLNWKRSEMLTVYIDFEDPPKPILRNNRLSRTFVESSTDPLSQRRVLLCNFRRGYSAYGIQDV